MEIKPLKITLLSSYHVRPEKFQFLENGKIVLSVKKIKIYSLDLG